MAIEQVLLELIDDNPYNPRKHYPQAKIKEMAESLRENGLRQVPEGRDVDGRVQLAYGHMRLRGYRSNQKHQVPGNWAVMPVDVKDISDRDIFHYAMEENLRRSDVTPLEFARCIEAFNQAFPDVLDEDIAKKHGMTAANVSNMKRVLRLPEKFLAKIDEGKITFTQGRELLTLEELPEAEQLMAQALSRIGSQYGEPNTVEGLQKAIHSVINNHFPPLEKEWAGYRYDLLFDTRAAGCLECKKMVRTHPTKTGVAHFCTDKDCWEKHQQEHKDAAAAAARTKMEAEVIQRAAEVIAKEGEGAEPPLEPTPVMIDENTIFVDQETLDKINASCSADRISENQAVRKPVEFEGQLYLAIGGSGIRGVEHVDAYVLVPREEYKGEVRTYKVPAGREYEEYYESLRNNPNGFYHGMLIKRGKGECVLVGPEVTFVTKVDKGDFSQEKSVKEMADEHFAEQMEHDLETRADERDRLMEEAREKANLERPVGDIPCETCAKGKTCDRSFFAVADDDSGRFVCDQWECDHVSWAKPAVLTEVSPQEIPDEVLQKARVAAGTRAEVLDVNDISTGDGWGRRIKPGYAILDGEIHLVDDPQECLGRCTRGFHFAFDSKAKEQKEIRVCSDPKCLAQKKGALTRKKNVEGLARKNAERKAIKQVLEQVAEVPERLTNEVQKDMPVAILTEPILATLRAIIKLGIYNQLHGKQVATYYYGDSKKPEKFFWDKLSAGTPQEKRNEEALWKLIEKLTDADLVKLFTEFLFYYIQDHGDTGSYEIKTGKPLGFFGVDVASFLEGASPEPEPVTEGGER